MILRNAMLAIVIAIAVFRVNASELMLPAEILSLCQEVIIRDKALKLANCTRSDNVTYASYEGLESKYSSSSEFDKVKVVIATSSDKKQLLERSGFRFKSGKPFFKETRLDVIISPDGVTKRENIRPFSEQGWSVNQENIQYFSPHDTGYVMSCFTAFKGRENINVTVAQCLSYGELESFKQLLRHIDFN